jgi:hypothetical protein
VLRSISVRAAPPLISSSYARHRSRKRRAAALRPSTPSSNRDPLLIALRLVEEGAVIFV